MENFDKWKVDYWSIFLSIVSILLGISSLFIKEEWRLTVLGFSSIGLIVVLVIYYVKKINFVEKQMIISDNRVKRLIDKFEEKINYISEISDIKARVNMLERNRKGEINLETVIKAIIAIILIYVLIEVIKSLFFQ